VEHYGFLKVESHEWSTELSLLAPVAGKIGGRRLTGAEVEMSEAEKSDSGINDVDINDPGITDAGTNESPLPSGCGLFFGWILACLLGGWLGWTLGWRLSMVFPGVISTLVIGGSTGLMLGGLQWLALRGHLRAAGWWAPASMLGWAGGFSLGVALAQYFGMVEIAFGLIVGLSTGALFGAAQWAVLNRQISRAWIWIPVNLLAWSSGLIYYRPGPSWLGLLFGVLAGLVTGVAILWLLYRPVAE
jgi:hypothetical protein